MFLSVSNLLQARYRIMKIVSIVGARPQFIKYEPLSREIRQKHEEIIVHTGQHYDPQMSIVFFEELQIPRPEYTLDIGSSSHGEQTGRMLIEIEKVLTKESPDLVLVYGDTNSTIAGALAAAKLNVSVAHIEAGLRSFDRDMPEEINRIVTDHLSALLFCPTQTAIDNLSKEGITKGAYLVGDVMADALVHNLEVANHSSRILELLELDNCNYLVLTIHRPNNTDNQENLSNIIEAAGVLDRLVVFPVHPRTKRYLQEYGIWDAMPKNIKKVQPLGYLDMLKLMANADKILTDSGGMQKEAFMLDVPCITLRETTEWVETLTDGRNVLVGANKTRIIQMASRNLVAGTSRRAVFGTGACKRIANVLERDTQTLA